MAELRLIESDEDLVPLLRKCSNELLAPLADYITNQGKGRLTSEIELLEVFKNNYPKGDHVTYVDELAAELQLFGGNTFANMLRGTGVSYREIACDVAGQLSVNFHREADIENIELQILLKILSKAYEKMSPEVRYALLKEIGQGHAKVAPKALPVAVLQAAIRAGGFTPYKLAVIVANAVAKQLLGRTLSFGANTALNKAIGMFAGPVGVALTAIWTAVDIAGPAYRVTIPCVIHVATIRQQLQIRTCPNGHEVGKGDFCPECGAKLP